MKSYSPLIFCKQGWYF